MALRALDLGASLVDVQQHYAEGVPLIVANREQIQQVVLNLLLNAEHAIKKLGQPGTISVRTGESDGSAFVDVSDDGPGIPDEVAGRIFEPFFTTKPIGEGTGLGLSVGMGIAQAHGGSLALVPAERGACFRLLLPSAAAVHVDLSALLARA
ncbi:MAG: hypothetical protein DMF96_04975 [Acidobacteria bacterium]|nr:MAG: hypothetical protein DMF96_04975 [Acidobacteriota bacterium]